VVAVAEVAPNKVTRTLLALVAEAGKPGSLVVLGLQLGELQVINQQKWVPQGQLQAEISLVAVVVVADTEVGTTDVLRRKMPKVAEAVAVDLIMAKL
jgi:hypothetical protein